MSEIELVSEGVAKLEGGFATRLLSQKEAAGVLGIALTNGFSEALTEVMMGRRSYRSLLVSPVNYLKLLRRWPGGEESS